MKECAFTCRCGLWLEVTTSPAETRWRCSWRRGRDSLKLPEAPHRAGIVVAETGNWDEPTVVAAVARRRSAGCDLTANQRPPTAALRAALRRVLLSSPSPLLSAPSCVSSCFAAQTRCSSSRFPRFSTSSRARPVNSPRAKAPKRSDQHHHLLHPPRCSTSLHFTLLRCRSRHQLLFSLPPQLCTLPQRRLPRRRLCSACLATTSHTTATTPQHIS